MSVPASSLRLPQQLLEPLCKPFRRQADCLLDLYEMTQVPSSPDRCVQCFFKLLGVATPGGRSALTPLCQWMENHLVIAIRAGDRQAGQLPLDLEAPTIEEFCQRAIQRVRQDTAVWEPEVELGLQFKQSEAV